MSRRGTVERAALDAIEAGTSIEDEIDTAREAWRDTSKILSRLRTKHRRAAR